MADTLRYINVDYTSHKDALIQRIRSRWPLVWNDFLSNSFGMLLIDLIAWTTATTTFLINRLAGENFITTMTLRESAQRIGALCNYKLHGPLPASCQCEATLSSAASDAIMIKKATLVRTSDGVVFEVDDDYTIAQNSTTPETLVLTISAEASGSKTITTNVTTKNGQNFVDLVDTTVDLSQYVSVGQSFKLVSSANIYKILDIVQSSSLTEKNRLILDGNFSDGTSSTDVIIGPAEIIDQRIGLIQGQTINDRFVAPSTDTPNYAVKLSKLPVIDGSVLVTVNGTLWTEVDTFFTSGSDEQVFTVKTLTTKTTVVQFGDDKFGSIIPTDSLIIVTYRVGGGSEGNIAVGEISASVTGFTVSSQNPVTVNLTNSTSAGIGGRDEETVDEARVNIPYFVRTNDRITTLDDWQTVAQAFTDPQFGSVAYARATVRTQNSLLEGNLVFLYAWTTGSDGGLVPLNLPLKSALTTYLQSKACGTDAVIVTDGHDRPAPIAIRVKTLSGFDISQVKSSVSSIINKSIVSLRPGSPIIFSDFVRMIDEAPGVDAVNLATPITDLNASDPTELFTKPSDTYRYAVDRSFIANSSSLDDSASKSITASKSDTTVTVTCTSHGYVTGQVVTISGATNSGFNISTAIIKVDDDSFTFTVDSSLPDGAVAGTLTAIAPVTIASYSAQLPITPLAVWSTRLFIGDVELTIIPDTTPGFARLYKTGVLSVSSSLVSKINLRTGVATLYLKGAQGDLTLGLKTITGYDRERFVNVYIGYTGTSTQAKRREIRAALRGWAEGFDVGIPMFSQEISGVVASKSNVTDVVKLIPGVTTVTRVALDTPSNPESRVNAGATELLKLGQIIIQNQLD